LPNINEQPEGRNTVRTVKRIAVLVDPRKHSLLVLSVALVALIATGVESFAASPPLNVGGMFGRIELVPGVPCKDCVVSLEGSGIGGLCGDDGSFIVKPIRTGLYVLQVRGLKGKEHLVVNGRLDVGISKDLITNVGTVVVSRYGAVHGQVIGADPKHLAEMMITISEFGIAAKPDAYGYYVLSRVPPGKWGIQLHGVWYNPKYPVMLENVTVQPRKITKKVNFVLKPPVVKPPVVKEMKKLPPYHRRTIDNPQPAKPDIKRVPKK
jgi:hypothetical protein